MLVPLTVVKDLLDTMFSVGDFMVMAGIGIGISTAATAVLVFILSIQLRRRNSIWRL